MPIYDDTWAGPGRNVKRVNGEPQRTTKWYVTIHNTSNDATARGEASYALRRTDGVGAHWFADDVEVLQSTDTDLCVGHVGSTQGNTRGISYEITGVNGWTREQWMANVAWDKLAAVVARDCRHFGIPVRLLTIDQMRAYSPRLKGWITHDMARRAWGGTDHTDPGPNFPIDHLMRLVSAIVNGDDMALRDEKLQLPAETLATGQRVPVTGDVEQVDGATALAYALRNAYAGRVTAEAVLALLGKGTPVTLTDADREAIVAGVVAELKPLLPSTEQIAKAVLAEQVRELTD